MNNVGIEVAGFPITADVNLRATFTHRDVNYEVTNHGRQKWNYGSEYTPSNGTYCYYVYIREGMMSPELFEEFWLTGRLDEKFSNHIFYDYHEARWSNAEWHCGVTWYSKVGGFDGEPRQVKIGCDYGHYWDDGMYYTLEGVKRDAIATVDALCEMFAMYRRDSYNGKWLPESEMVAHNDRLYTPEGYAAMMKYQAERAAEKSAAETA